MKRSLLLSLAALAAMSLPAAAFDCAKACPKGLNPAKAIAEIKKLMVERRV